MYLEFGLRLQEADKSGAGTYVRTVAIDTLVGDFLASNRTVDNGESDMPSQLSEDLATPVQIISLGAGTDTRFFRLRQRYGAQLARRLRYHEIDFPDTGKTKIDSIDRASFVSQLLRDTARESHKVRRQEDTSDSNVSGTNADDSLVSFSEDKNSLQSPAYSFHALDLRRLADDEASIADLLPGVQPNAPTLVLSECCLTYFSVTTANAILRNLARFLRPLQPSSSKQTSTLAISTVQSTLAVLLYEPLHPTTPFGRTMASNLSLRGISLPSVAALPSVEAHRARLHEAFGAEGSRGVEVRKWWEREVTEDEKERLRRVEGLDEEEEWELLAGHYGFVWGWRGSPVGGRWEPDGEQVTA